MQQLCSALNPKLVAYFSAIQILAASIQVLPKFVAKVINLCDISHYFNLTILVTGRTVGVKMLEEERKKLTEFIEKVMPKLVEKAERPQRLIQQVLNYTKGEGPVAAQRLFEFVVSRSDSLIIAGEESRYVERLITEFSNKDLLDNKENQELPENEREITLTIPEKTLHLLTERQGLPQKIRESTVRGIYDEHIQPIARQKFNEVTEKIFGELEFIAGFTNRDKEQI